MGRAPSADSRSGFSRCADALVVYLLLVIAFGAWVRVTGSGAGCGDHWPSCHGQLLPRSPSQQTVIEYTHRVSSGLLGLLALALPFWAMRVFPAGHAVRRLSWATLLLIAVEGGIGAGLVLQGLVADDASASRALVVALHLGNTLLLTASAALMALHSRRHVAAPRVGWARQGPLKWALAALLGGLLVVASSGAVTALGDTLFPVSASPPDDHFLVRLRVVHPLIACLVTALAVWIALRVEPVPGLSRRARLLGVLSGAQLLLGAVNVALDAPGWMQLVHLLAAQLLWISAVLLWSGWARRGTVSEVTA
jgi:heme A synthase